MMTDGFSKQLSCLRLVITLVRVHNLCDNWWNWISEDSSLVSNATFIRDKSFFFFWVEGKNFSSSDDKKPDLISSRKGNLGHFLVFNANVSRLAFHWWVYPHLHWAPFFTFASCIKKRHRCMQMRLFLMHKIFYPKHAKEHSSRSIWQCQK